MSCGHCRGASRVDRRAFLGMLGLGLATTVAGCSASGRRAPAARTPPSAPPPPEFAGVAPTTTTTTTPPIVVHGPIPPPHPGPPTVISKAPIAGQQIALTIDDGYCGPCAAAYVDFAHTTGTHITFSPNGTFAHIWEPLASTLRPLIEAGQVQIGNHTYTHANLRRLSDTKIRAELERNDQWIQSTFKITSRPWFRPPYGFHNRHTDGVVASLGYTNVLMWNGSFGDSIVLTPKVLLAQAQKYLVPGTIMLGHANHPTVTELFPQILEIIKQRNLQPVTLDEMFGTSRDHG